MNGTCRDARESRPSAVGHCRKRAASYPDADNETEGDSPDETDQKRAALGMRLWRPAAKIENNPHGPEDNATSYYSLRASGCGEQDLHARGMKDRAAVIIRVKALRQVWTSKRLRTIEEDCGGKDRPMGGGSRQESRLRGEGCSGVS